MEYARRAPNGLANQSWKDSDDSQQFRDGRLAKGPIAPAEVQGYVYDARLRLAELAREVWRDTALAIELEQRATELRDRFDRDFWLEERAAYALALDGEKRPLDVLSSNNGHLLWSGIVPDGRVAEVTAALCFDELWSGWGVRTMGASESGYNPLGYHTGTVWPHDTALAAWVSTGPARGSTPGSSAAACSRRRASRPLAARGVRGLPARGRPFPSPTRRRPAPRPGRPLPILCLRLLLGLHPDPRPGALRPAPTARRRTGSGA